MLLLASLARAKLLYGDVEGTKADMDRAWKVLDAELAGSGVDAGVNAAYYSIAADYYKVRVRSSPAVPACVRLTAAPGEGGLRAVLPELAAVPRVR